MSYTNGTGTTGSVSLSLKDMEAAIEKLRGLPPARWLLMSPDGRVFIDEDPRALIRALCLYGSGPLALDPLGLEGTDAPAL